MIKRTLSKLLIIFTLILGLAVPLSAALYSGFPGDTLSVNTEKPQFLRYWVLAHDTLNTLDGNNRQTQLILPDLSPGNYSIRLLNKQQEVRDSLNVTVPNRAPYFTHSHDSLFFQEDSNYIINKQDIISQGKDKDIQAELHFSFIPGKHIQIAEDPLSCRLIPDPNWNGQESIYSIVSDGSLTDTLEIMVSISPVNDAPIIVQPEHAYALEDELIRYPFSALYDLVRDIDTSSDSLKWKYIHGSHLKISPEGSQLTLLATENWFGLDTVHAVVSDGEFSDTLHWVFTIIAVNDPPVLRQLEELSFLEDDTLSLNRNYLQNFASDVESESADLKWQMKRLGKIRAFYNGAQLQCYGHENWNGTDSIRITVSDGELSSSRIMILHILPVNDAPVIKAIPDQISREDDTLYISHRYMGRFANDVETKDSKLTWIYSSSSRFVHVEDQKKRIKITADRNWNGKSRIQVIICDENLSDTSNFLIHVRSVNDKPVVISPPAGQFNEDDTLRIPMKNIYSYAHDVEIRNSDLLWDLKGSTSLHAIKQNGMFKIFADPDWNGVDSLALIVSDGGLQDTARWKMTVKPVNDAPRWTSLPDTSIVEDNILVMPKPYLMNFVHDPDEGDSVDIWLNGSENITVETRNDTFVIWPYTDWFGKENLTLGSTDGHVKDSIKWSIAVEAINDPPYFTIYMPDSISFRADQADTLFMKDVVYDIDNKQEDLIWDIRPGRNVKCFINDKLNAIIFHTEKFASGEDAVTIQVTDGDNMIIQYMPVFVHEIDRFLMAIPERLELFPNSPNPFTKYTTITYSLPVAGYVTLKIYNILGEEVKSLTSEYQDAQSYRYLWYGEDESNSSVPSGVYLCRLVAQIEGESVIKMQKMMLVR